MDDAARGMAQRSPRCAAPRHLPPRRALRAHQRAGLRGQGDRRAPAPPNEFRLLRQLERLGLPVGRGGRRRLRPARRATASPSIRRSSRGTCSSPCPTARSSPGRCARTPPPASSTRSPRCSYGSTSPASTGATARCPTPCSGATPAPSRPTSSTRRPASCTCALSRGQRAYDVDMARTNIIGEMFDLAGRAACCTRASTPSRPAG